jgi:hypothetical protein
MSPLLAAFDWQTAVVGAVVGLATVYLTNRYRKAWTSSDKKACGGGCGTCSAAEQKPLVSIAPLPEKKPSP